MGLYDSWQLDSEILKKAGIIIGAVLIIAIIAWGITVIFQPQPLQTQLSGFINLAKSPDGFPLQPNTELTITITNPFQKAAENVSVFVVPEDKKSLIVFPESIPVKTLDKSRTIVVSIRPNPAERVLSGTYLLNVSMMIGEEKFSKQVELEIKNPTA